MDIPLSFSTDIISFSQYRQEKSISTFHPTEAKAPKGYTDWLRTLRTTYDRQHQKSHPAHSPVVQTLHVP